MGKKQNTQTEDFKKLQDELDAVKQLSLQLENQLKRAVADYHNLEKRVAEGRSELTKWGTGELLVKILPTLDHLEQVVDRGRPILSERSESKDWFRGVELAVKELNQVLQSEGLEQIVSDGQFDPNLHEAVDTQAGEDNKILKVVRKGYTLNGKVLRPAAVVVGRRHSGEEQSDDTRIDSGQARMTENEKGETSS
ncbi:nucleotide exchange factor GrpE [Candidatus Daviesbacteria bacterium]|nr:nucleotide exchange factor GrpE [Candidatus Daviesbacteria bacterium]